MKEKITLVLGASPKPERFSHIAVKKLIASNYPVVAVGLREGEIAGIRGCTLIMLDNGTY